MSLTAVVRLGVLLVAVACGIALPYVVGTFLLGTATLALIYGLFALSVNLLAGYGGLLSLGHAGIMATAAYGTGYVATHSHGGHLEQVIVGLVAALAASAVFGLMAMRTRAVYFLMVTLAQGMIVFGLASSLAPITGAENGLTGVARPGWVAQDWQYYYLCLLVLLLCAGMMWVVVRSPFGLALRGLRESSSRLRMLGYNPTLHTFYGFVLSGFFAGVAGVLFAYDNQFVSPSVAEFATSAQGILMVLVGGIATLSGPVVGAFIIVLAQNWLSLHTDRWLTIQGIVFVLIVLFAREGLVGALAKAWGAVMERRAARAAPVPERPAITRPTADAKVSRHEGKVT